MARRRRLVVASAVIAAAVFAVAIALDLSSAPVDPPGVASTPSTTAIPSPAPTTAPSAAPAAVPTATSTPEPSAASPTAQPPTPADLADPLTPLEVSGPAPEQTGLPPSAPRPALVTLPLPPSASADGALVPGFPSTVVPVLPGAQVLSSSVGGDGSILRVGLVARGAADAEAIVNGYRDALTTLGFTSAEVPGTPGGRAVVFSSGTDSVNLSIDPTEGGSTAYSVFAVLHAG